MKHFAKTLVSPASWANRARIARNLLSNLTRYRRFSLNPNTVSHWNKRLSRLGDTWRDEHYRHILDLLPTDEPFTLLDIGCALGDGCELLQSR